MFLRGKRREHKSLPTELAGDYRELTANEKGTL